MLTMAARAVITNNAFDACPAVMMDCHADAGQPGGLAVLIQRQAIRQGLGDRPDRERRARCCCAIGMPMVEV